MGDVTSFNHLRDCCPKCAVSSASYEPIAVVSRDAGWVRLAYNCEHGHLWECGWDEDA